MIQQERKPGRFGTHASVIQLLALLIANTGLDGGTTLYACALASLLFWTCALPLLRWHRGRASRAGLLFLRWGLLPFVLIGTPLLWPVVSQWEWHVVVLAPGIAVLFVMSLMYLVVRVFGLASPFDELGLDLPVDGKPPPPEV